MKRLKVGLLSKKRGNFTLQEKFRGPTSVVDSTSLEVEHHRKALTTAGYDVSLLTWGPDIVRDVQASGVDLAFNVSSLAEAALLEDLGVPYVGSDTVAIAASLNKALAKKLWRVEGLPTSQFFLARSEEDCEAFRNDPPIPFPLFVKPVAGRGSAGVDASSVVQNADQLRRAVAHRLTMMQQPVLIERFLRGREVTLGVLGNEKARVLPPLEIVYREGDVTLSFEKKELDDDSFFCPARLSEEESRAMKDLALRAYRTLGFLDFGRIDTILTPYGPFLLEANSFAGLMCTPREKPHSYIGFMARAEGMTGTDLLGEIVQNAVARLGLVA
jgi:D-alanine-D-alanine ligase